MSVLLVDWLGRGGIAQTTEAWALELGARGESVEVVTRPGRELGDGPVNIVAAELRGNRIGAHRAVADAAARHIREHRPSVVVIQNFVLPVLERGVITAARGTGACLVQVVHDHRLHTYRAGSWVGMAPRLRSADVVIAHTEHVARGVRSFAGRDDVVVTPLPVPVGMLPHPPTVPIGDAEAGSLQCGHFGVLRRGYKGTATVEALAAAPPPGWQFVVAGVGAPPSGTGLRTLDRFLAARRARRLGRRDRRDLGAVPVRDAERGGGPGAPVGFAAGRVRRRRDARADRRRCGRPVGVPERTDRGLARRGRPRFRMTTSARSCR